MMMTTFQIPSFSFDRKFLRENSSKVISLLKPDDKIINIIAPRRSGKSTFIAYILADCLEYNIFERIICISSNRNSFDQLLRLAHATFFDEVLEELTSTRDTISTDKSRIIFTTMEVQNRFEGYKTDLIIIDDCEHLSERAFCELYSCSIRSQGIITTSTIPLKYFKSSP